jgi:C4-dicarboxylate-specific signal transduction histidine kinase
MHSEASRVSVIRALTSDDGQGSALSDRRRLLGNPINLDPSADQLIEAQGPNHRGCVTLDVNVLGARGVTGFVPVTGEKEPALLGAVDVNDGLPTEEKMEKLQGEIAHAARISMLGELAASIAHEVSQPLTAIGSNTEATQLWLDRSPPNLDEVRELTARTAAEVQRAADIIHRIRAMAVRSAPERVRVAVNSVIEEAILLLRHELQRNRVYVSLELEDRLPDILGDRIQLQQVIVNLAVNAIQAMSSTASTARQLLVRSSVITEEWVQIVVQDTGPGIATESRDRVFERYFTTKSAGMGIGLSICRTIIEAHHGRIDVPDLQDSDGARFTIILPTCVSASLAD